MNKYVVAEYAGNVDSFKAKFEEAGWAISGSESAPYINFYPEEERIAFATLPVGDRIWSPSEVEAFLSAEADDDDASEVTKAKVVYVATAFATQDQLDKAVEILVSNSYEFTSDSPTEGVYLCADVIGNLFYSNEVPTGAVRVYSLEGAIDELSLHVGSAVHDEVRAEEPEVEAEEAPVEDDDMTVEEALDLIDDLLADDDDEDIISDEVVEEREGTTLINAEGDGYNLKITTDDSVSINVSKESTFAEIG